MGLEFRRVLFRSHDTSDTNYDPDTTTKPFLYSHDETEGWTVIPKTGLYINLRSSGRSSLAPLSKIGKIKAETGYKVSIKGCIKTSFVITDYTFEDGITFEFEDGINYEFSN